MCRAAHTRRQRVRALVVVCRAMFMRRVNSVVCVRGETHWLRFACEDRQWRPTPLVLAWKHGYGNKQGGRIGLSLSAILSYKWLMEFVSGILRCCVYYCALCSYSTVRSPYTNHYQGSRACVSEGHVRFEPFEFNNLCCEYEVNLKMC